MTGEFKYLGVTDETVVCEQCGRTELRNTVVLGVLDADGDVDGVTYYGSTCAARALGVTSGAKVIKAARAAHAATKAAADDARRMLENHGIPAEGVTTTAQLIKAATKYAAANPSVCTSYDAALEATMDMVARKRRDIREFKLLTG